MRCSWCGLYNDCLAASTHKVTLVVLWCAISAFDGFPNSDGLLSKVDLHAQFEVAKYHRKSNCLSPRETAIEENCSDNQVLYQVKDQELHFDLTLPIQAMKRIVAAMNGDEKMILFPGMLVMYPAIP